MISLGEECRKPGVLNTRNGKTQKINKEGGVPMSFEAIKGISDAETLANAKVAEAEAKAKQMLLDAEAAGKAAGRYRYCIG